METQTSSSLSPALLPLSAGELGEGGGGEGEGGRGEGGEGEGGGGRGEGGRGGREGNSVSHSATFH